jgi:hypothetical protein
MIKYAKQKSKSLVGKDGFNEPWYKCLSCKQPFKAQLALEMTSAFISFTESTYGCPPQSYNDKLCVMIALRLRIVRIVDLQREFLMNNRHQWGMVKGAVPVDEGKMLSNKLLSMVKQIKEKEQMTHSQLKASRVSEGVYCSELICVGENQRFTIGRADRWNIGEVIINAQEQSERGLELKACIYQRKSEWIPFVQLSRRCKEEEKKTSGG